MASLETIRTITIKGTSEGLDETTAKLKALTAAQDNVSVVSEKATKSQLSVQNALDRQQRSLDMTYRSTQQYGKVVGDLDRAHAQGLTTLDRHNQLMKLASDRYGQGSVAGTAFKNSLSGVQGQLVALSAGASPVGVFLSGLGPWGVAAAVGLGAAVVAFGSLKQLANDMGESASKLKDFAESTGLTITQLKGLEKAGLSVGVESEQTAQFVEHFTLGLLDLRRGHGQLYDELNRDAPALVREMQLSKGVADAYNIWARAIANATSEEERNKLARAAGGRTGIASGRTAGVVAAAGGIDNLTAPGGTEAQIKLWADLQTKIKETDAATRSIFGSIFTTEVLQGELQFSQGWKSLAEQAKEFKTSSSWDNLVTFFRDKSWSEIFDKLTSAGGLGNIISGRSQYLNPSTFGNVGGVAGALTRPDAYPSPIGPQRPQAGPTPEAIASRLKEQMAILGPAATTTETLRLKQAELNAEVAKTGNQYGGLAQRAMDAFRVQQSGADLQIKVANAAATATELYVQRQSELRLLVGQGKLTQDQATASLQAYEKTIEQTVAQMEIMKAKLPGLKALELETGNLRTQVDAFSVGSLNSLASGLADITSGTVPAAQGFKNLGQTVLKSLEEMLIKMTVVRGAAMALNAALSGLGIGSIGAPLNINAPGVSSAMGNVFNRGNVIPFARGGIVDRPTIFPMANGMGLMGEAGPEAVMPLRRTSDGRLGVAGGGGGGMQVNVHNYSGGEASTERKRGPDGREMVNVVIAEVKRDMAGGGFDKSMQRFSGGRPNVRRS